MDIAWLQLLATSVQAPTLITTIEKWHVRFVKILVLLYLS